MLLILDVGTSFFLIFFCNYNHNSYNSSKNNQSSKRGEELRKIEAIAKEVLSSNDCLSVKELAVKGEDLKALGFSGKEIGDTLSYLLDLVLSGEKNEKDLLLEKAKKQRR